jgi:hypothetical protein
MDTGYLMAARGTGSRVDRARGPRGNLPARASCR